MLKTVSKVLDKEDILIFDCGGNTKENKKKVRKLEFHYLTLKAKKKKRPKHLKVAVPESTEHGDASTISHATKTPSKSSAKRKRPTATAAGANSKGKGAVRRGRASNDSKASTAEYDINDVVIPWSEIRGNFTIPDVKPVEIFTPEWRSVETRK